MQRQPQRKIRRPHGPCSFNRKGCAGGTRRRENPRHMPDGKPPARPLPARTVAFLFACVATAVSAAWVGGSAGRRWLAIRVVAVRALWAGHRYIGSINERLFARESYQLAVTNDKIPTRIALRVVNLHSKVDC